MSLKSLKFEPLGRMDNHDGMIVMMSNEQIDAQRTKKENDDVLNCSVQDKKSIKANKIRGDKWVSFSSWLKIFGFFQTKDFKNSIFKIVHLCSSSTNLLLASIYLPYIKINTNVPRSHLQ